MEPSPSEWQPAAPHENLRLRAELLRQAREYFAEQGVMEVQTPILSRAAVTDLHLHSLRTRVTGHGDFFLQASPEYAMKRLLAAGSGDIYQITQVFRDAERGVLHNPEFTMLEWYRLGFDAKELMTDAARLLSRLLPERRLEAPEHLTYRDAFLRHARVDPLSTTAEQLRECAHAHEVPIPPLDPDDRDGYLDLLMSMVVGPKLGSGRLTFVYEYPASQAALARLKPDDLRVAERFEIYLQGIELANGYHELGHPAEQRRRFEHDLKQRRARGMAEPPMDERLLAALAAGLPHCSGIAMGFDRVVMLAAGATSLDAILAFPLERA